jgi:hypothetical protein
VRAIIAIVIGSGTSTVQSSHNRPPTKCAPFGRTQHQGPAVGIDCRPFRVGVSQSPRPILGGGGRRDDRFVLRHGLFFITELPRRQSHVVALSEQTPAPDRWFRTPAGSRRHDAGIGTPAADSVCALGARQVLIRRKMVASTELSRQECGGQRGSCLPPRIAKRGGGGG